MNSASELHDRINRVINTPAFEAYLDSKGLDLIEFQCTWYKVSQGNFDKLPDAYQGAIIAGEQELKGDGEVVLT